MLSISSDLLAENFQVKLRSLFSCLIQVTSAFRPTITAVNFTPHFAQPFAVSHVKPFKIRMSRFPVLRASLLKKSLKCNSSMSVGRAETSETKKPDKLAYPVSPASGRFSKNLISLRWWHHGHIRNSLHVIHGATFINIPRGNSC